MTAAKKPADAQARDHTDEAIDVIHSIMIDPFSEAKDRLRAAETLLDRGHGKAVSAVISVPLARRQQTQLAAMTDEELMVHIRETPLPRLAAPETFICGVEGCPGDHANELEICAEVVEDVDPLLL